MRKSLIFLTAICLAQSSSSHAQSLGIVDRSQGSFIFLDLSTERTSNVDNVGTFPHEVALDKQRNLAYVPDYGGNTVAIIDVGKRKLNQKVSLPGFERLHGVVVANGHVWVTAEEQRVLVPLDTGLDPIPTQGYRSHMVTDVPGRPELYVANMDTGTVSILHPEASSPVVLTTGKGSEGIDASPDGAEVWVSNRSENTISIIDTDLREVAKTIWSHGNFPVKLVFRPDGEEVWVSNNRSGTVAIFDAATKTLRHLVKTGERPLGIVFSEDSRFGYISRPGGKEILEIETNDGFQISRRLEIAGSPDGMIWIGARKYAVP